MRSRSLLNVFWDTCKSSAKRSMGKNSPLWLTSILRNDICLPSVDKGTHGFAPQICDSAALLSLGVRPVRLVPVPCRITNLRRKTPSDPNHRILVAGKATDEGVLGVRRLTLTRPAAKRRRLGRVCPCSLRVLPPLLFISLVYIL